MPRLRLVPALLAAGLLFAASAASAQTSTTRGLYSPPMKDHNRYACHLYNSTAQAVTVARIELVYPDVAAGGTTAPAITADAGTCSAVGGPLNFTLAAGRSCWIQATLPATVWWPHPENYQVSCRVRHGGPAGALLGALVGRQYNSATGSESEFRSVLPLQEMAAATTTLP